MYIFSRFNSAGHSVRQPLNFRLTDSENCLTCPAVRQTSRTLLFDITPKLRSKVKEEGQLDHLKSLMRQGQGIQRGKTEGDHFDCEIDLQFYLYQAKVSKI